MELLIAWVACGIASAVIANSKGRNGFGWFVLGMLFAIFAVILVACLPSRRQPGPYTGKDIGRYYDPKLGTTTKMPKPDIKQCPRCAEDVKQAAIVCKHCGHEFGEGGTDFRSRLARPKPSVIMRDR